MRHQAPTHSTSSFTPRSPAASAAPARAPEIDDDGPPLIVAMTLATELADVVGARGAERQSLQQTALVVGGWLAEVGVAGCWERIDVRALLEALSLSNPRERGELLLSLTALVGHAALTTQLDARAARAIVRDIAELTKGEPAIHVFAQHTVKQLQGMLAARS
jgi:hypothetical protein